MCLGLREVVFRPNKPGRREYILGTTQNESGHVNQPRIKNVKSTWSSIIYWISYIEIKQYGVLPPFRFKRFSFKISPTKVDGEWWN